MKFSTLLLAAIITLAGFSSCSKNKDNAPVPIEGYWEGTYVNDASGNTFFYAFRIKPGGIMEELDADGDKIGEGIWTLEPNNIFMGYYEWPSGLGFSVMAGFYPENGQLLGNWGYNDDVTDGGTWEMTRKGN